MESPPIAFLFHHLAWQHCDDSIMPDHPDGVVKPRICDLVDFYDNLICCVEEKIQAGEFVALRLLDILFGYWQ